MTPQGATLGRRLFIYVAAATTILVEELGSTLIDVMRVLCLLETVVCHRCCQHEASGGATILRHLARGATRCKSNLNSQHRTLQHLESPLITGKLDNLTPASKR